MVSVLPNNLSDFTAVYGTKPSLLPKFRLPLMATSTLVRARIVSNVDLERLALPATQPD